MRAIFERWYRRGSRETPLREDGPSLTRAAVAEFIGTFILVAIGNGSVAQSQLTRGEKGDYFTINWGWALGCSLGIFVSSSVSGGHLNPAVTMALAFTKEFPWKKVPAYFLAQYLGALAASGMVLGVYYEAIMQLRGNGEFRIRNDPTDPGSASIFANYPAPYLSASTGLVEEILSTMIFMLVICVTTDKNYSKVPSYLQPLFIGFTLLAIGVAYGSNGGYALNPARDFAPRLVSLFGGWGINVFRFRGYNWFWIYLVGPHIGAILGVCIFQLLLKDQKSVVDGCDGASLSESESPVVDFGKVLDAQWQLYDIEPDMNKCERDKPPSYHRTSWPQVFKSPASSSIL